MDFNNLNLDLDLINETESGKQYISLIPVIRFPLNKSLVLDTTNQLKIKTTNQSLELLKNELINKVHKKSKEIYGTYININVIKDCYCDAKKLYLFNNNYEEIILVNDKSELSVEKNSYIEGTIEISKLWISGKSFGPIVDLINFNKVTDQNTNEFLNDSDNESVIEYDF